MIQIQRSELNGFLQVPSSKSYAQRALAAVYFCDHEVELKNVGNSNDVIAILTVLSLLGRRVERAGNSVVISKETDTQDCSLNFGESGLGVRMFLPILALSCRKIEVSGIGSLISRPMDSIFDIFPSLDISVESDNNHLPAVIQGPMNPKSIDVDGSISSQFLTGLLFAYSASNAFEYAIKVRNLKSKPYIDMTLDVIKDFGLSDIRHINYEEFKFYPSTADKKIQTYTIEGDWSSGAILLVSGICSEFGIELSGLNKNSKQADKSILVALERASVKFEWIGDTIKVSKSNLTSFEFDATDCPDLFPPLVCLAFQCPGVSTIKGVSRLKHKESDRAKTLQSEFTKLGASVSIVDDIMTVENIQNFVSRNTVIDPCNDHRIAMVCTLAALTLNVPIKMIHAECVAKSYPSFFDDIISLGANITNISI